MSDQVVTQTDAALSPRYYLMPLDVMVMILNVPDEHLVTIPEDADENKQTTTIFQEVLNRISGFKYTLDANFLIEACAVFISMHNDYRTVYKAYEDIIHIFEEDAETYGEHNWEQGIPMSKLISRCVNDLVAYCKGNCQDENFRDKILFDLMTASWTAVNFGDMIDMPKFIVQDDNSAVPEGEAQTATSDSASAEN